MIIEINKDIDRYKETVIMGLTARQLIFSVLSVAVGGGIVLFFYPLIGMTPSVYLAIPAVAPIAPGGFYSFNGMNFYEYMGRKMRMLFANRPLAYVSTENEGVIKEIRVRETEKNSRKNKGKGDVSY
ncbi:MAG: PrgI family protein [Lachnospiraceae bacterium]|nr:PrgI family protein [Lachnospiraceae bacterium]